MKNTMKAVLAGCLSFLAVAAYAGVSVKDIKWQAANPVASGKAVFLDVPSLSLADIAKSGGKVRLVVHLVNTGAAKDGGRVLRCAFSMRLAKEGSAEPGVWTVPFSIDERRIAMVSPGEPVEVTVSHTGLQNYLKRMAGTGFRPDRLRASVMLEPRRGDTLADGMGEAEVELK
jgi:hypothetical protein